jgi:uncharacterized membrane protein YjjB (DUF3815 family)
VTSLWQVLWAAPAATGFAMLFNVRKTALPLVAAIAVLAMFISKFCQHLGLTLIAADFIAAFVVGAIAYTLAPRIGEASPVFAFAPVIPLVPGSMFANALITSFNTWLTHPGSSPEVNEQFITSMSTGISALAIIIALCLGAISPMLLLPRSRTPED